MNKHESSYFYISKLLNMLFILFTMKGSCDGKPYYLEFNHIDFNLFVNNESNEQVSEDDIRSFNIILADYNLIMFTYNCNYFITRHDYIRSNRIYVPSCMYKNISISDLEMSLLLNDTSS